MANGKADLSSESVPPRNLGIALAGRTSHADSMSDPLSDLDANVVSQLHLLETIRRENPTIRIVFAGTRQVYGRPHKLPVSEDHPLDPPDVNAVHKIAAEGYHRLYDRVYGIPSSVLRLTNCYGPRMRIKDARQTFIGAWIRLLLEGKPFEVWGGDQKRDFSFSEDVTEAFLRAAQPAARGSVFNVGGETASLRELAELLLGQVEGRFVVKDFPVDRKHIDIGDFVADDSAFRAAILPPSGDGDGVSLRGCSVAFEKVICSHRGRDHLALLDVDHRQTIDLHH